MVDAIGVSMSAFLSSRLVRGLLFPLFVLGYFNMTLTVDAQALNENERIVFLGDSITQSGVNPGGYVTIIKEALAADEQFKGVEIIGAGVSGDRVPDVQKRLQKDVLEKNPTLVVIYIGINDVWHWDNDRGTTKEEFKTGLGDVIGQIKNAGARVILCTPSVIGEKHDGSNAQDEMLDEYSQLSRDIAKSENVQLLDLRRSFLSRLRVGNKENAGASVLTTDGVHLNPDGNKFVAKLMLGALKTEHHKTGSLRHVVLFKFKDDLAQEKIDEVVNEFAELKNKIDFIQDYEHGTNISAENLAEGYTHCFVVTFKSEADRDAYLPHQAHKDFVEFLSGKIDKVLVVDFWAE